MQLTLLQAVAEQLLALKVAAHLAYMVAEAANKAATFDHTLTEAGQYPYFCPLHPNMVGTVRVGKFFLFTLFYLHLPYTHRLRDILQVF
jgi:hypothetical protein